MSHSAFSYPLITLTPEQRGYAERIAAKRNATHAGDEGSDSGMDDERAHILGAYGEIAVCLHYGEDYRAHVEAYERARGPSPDARCSGYTISVKGRDRWQLPLDLIVLEHDTRNDIYLLVSVDLEQGICGLRGWITQPDLLRYPAEEWKWDKTRPGARRPIRRRYVPVQRLRPCRATAVSAIQAPGATIAAARPQWELAL